MCAAGESKSGAVDLLDPSVDGLVIVDVRGVVRFANTVARDLLGNEPWEPFCLPDTGNPAVLRLPNAGQGGRDLEVRAWPATWEGNPATLASIRGVTGESDGIIDAPTDGAGTDSTAFPAPAESPRAPEQTRPRCILVVEDQSRIRRLVTRILAAEGFRVIEAEDADAALARLEEHGDGVDLLLTDIVMPGLTGPELAEKVHALMPRLNVLFMSGYTNGYLSDAGDDVGTAVPSERFLQKPFSVEQLLDRIEHVLGPTGESGSLDRPEE